MVKEVLGAVKGLEVIGSRVRCADGPYIGGGAEGNELLLPLSTVMRGNRFENFILQAVPPCPRR